MQEDDWRGYWRNLPHFRMRGAIYFVTWRLRASHSELNPAERTDIVQTLSHFHRTRYDLLAYVVMNDHVHALVKPYDGWRLDEILHSWKSFTARTLQAKHGRIGRVWQDESFDRIVRDEAELEQKANYILTNPMKRWPEAREYAWVGFNCEE